MPAIGLGCFEPDDWAEPEVFYNAIIKNNYRHLDTASLYENEERIGVALTQVLKEKKITRDQLFITTKIWMNAYDNPQKSCEESLARLQLDYVDMILLHWPT